uniref:Transmembrane p24 trafficking protein 1b n=1 Tax=Lates calcarifer TaxID=8187 RepID=A0A4W6DIG7_LATCA
MTQRATYSYRTSVFTKSRLWLLALAAIFGWCFGSVRCFGQSQDSELTFLLPAGRLECFFQTAVKNGTMEVEYQVIAGAGMDVDFTILSPEGIRLIVESRRSDGVHVLVLPNIAGINLSSFFFIYIYNKSHEKSITNN